jgi:uncharacterized protein (DUF58 family)
MSWSPSAKRRAYLALCVATLLAGLAFGRPELVACASAFGAISALGRRGEVNAQVAIEPVQRTLIEGQAVTFTIRLDPGDGIARARLRPVATPALGLAARSVELSGGRQHRVELVAHPARWGAYSLPPLELHAIDHWGLSVATTTVQPPADRLRVLPAGLALRGPVAPPGTQAAPGDWPSSRRGAGTEFADLRPYVAGDPTRRINWRASARRGVPFVAERRAELTAELVLFVDTFDQAELALAVRVAAALARLQLTRRDRVGVVAFGGAPWWILPGVGRVQLERIIERLLASRVIANVAPHDVRQLPRGALPPRATVVAITSLTDDRVITALLELARRGRDLAILELDVEATARSPVSRAGAAACRLWALERQATRTRLREAGVACARVAADRPLAVAIEEVNAWRRATRRTVIV